MGEFLKENRERIILGYEKTAEELPEVFKEISKKLEELDDETALAVKYLYMTMPFSDIGNYSFEVYLDYAENGVSLWRESEAVRNLPELLYLNYVLYHRVNEEEIAPCRKLFRSEIHKFMQEKGETGLLETGNRKDAAIGKIHCLFSPFL